MKKDIFNESKKLSMLSVLVRNKLECWNYEEIFLPFVEEYSESLRGGMKYSDGKSFYLIRPDATSQIIDRLRAKGEYRYFYFNDYFPGDGNCSIQFGAEFIGENPLQQKVEILNVAASILRSACVKDFYMDMGSLKHVNGILGRVSGFKNEILEAMAKRNFSLIRNMEIDEDIKCELWKIFGFRGKRSGIGVLDEIIENLREDNIFIDTGTVRYLDYYEDVVFEIYTSASGRPLGGGGDYSIAGMTGFGFFIDLKLLAEITGFQPAESRERVEGGIKEVYASAGEMIREGKKVEVVL